MKLNMSNTWVVITTVRALINRSNMNYVLEYINNHTISSISYMLSSSSLLASFLILKTSFTR